MLRVLGRQTSSKFNYFLVSRQPADSANSYCGSRNSGLNLLGLQTMESSALKTALIGRATFLCHAGERGGRGRPGRNVVARRSLKDNGKLISQKSGRSSSRIESARDFSAQRLLDCAVDVLRNFNEKVNNFRNRWKRDESLDLPTAADEKQSLRRDTLEAHGRSSRAVYLEQDIAEPTPLEQQPLSSDAQSTLEAQAVQNGQSSVVLGGEQNIPEPAPLEQQPLSSDVQSTLEAQAGQNGQSSVVLGREQNIPEPAPLEQQPLSRDAQFTLEAQAGQNGKLSVVLDCEQNTQPSSPLEADEQGQLSSESQSTLEQERPGRNGNLSEVLRLELDTQAAASLEADQQRPPLRNDTQSTLEEAEGRQFGSSSEVLHFEQDTRAEAPLETRRQPSLSSDAQSTPGPEVGEIGNSSVVLRIEQDSQATSPIEAHQHQPPLACNTQSTLESEVGQIGNSSEVLRIEQDTQARAPLEAQQQRPVISDAQSTPDAQAGHSRNSSENLSLEQDTQPLAQLEAQQQQPFGSDVIQIPLELHVRQSDLQQSSKATAPFATDQQRSLSNEAQSALQTQLGQNGKSSEVLVLELDTGLAGSLDADQLLPLSSDTESALEAQVVQNGNSANGNSAEFHFLEQDTEATLPFVGDQQQLLSSGTNSTLDVETGHIGNSSEQDSDVTALLEGHRQQMLSGETRCRSTPETQVGENGRSSRVLYLDHETSEFAQLEVHEQQPLISDAQSTLEVQVRQSRSSPDVHGLKEGTQAAAPLEIRDILEASASGYQPSLEEADVVDGEKSFQEHRSEDLGAPPKEQDTDDSTGARERQITLASVTDSDSFAHTHSGEMEKQELALDINRLRSSIAHHAYLYNTLDCPTIRKESHALLSCSLIALAYSDAAYDMLVKELKELEIQASNSASSPNVLVGAEPAPEMLKVIHSVPMLSLASVQKEDELLSWYQRLQSKLSTDCEPAGWVVEPKVDGLALALRYEHGKLVCAATRGNGIQGEDVTHNAQRVLGIPLNITHHFPGMEDILMLLEVRGEIFMSLKHFKELNATKIQSGEKPMANPRNSAAGFMRLLGTQNSNRRPLNFVAYSIANIEVSAGPRKENLEKSISRPKTQWESLQLLKSIGFAINKDNQVFSTFDSALEYAKSWRNMRQSLEYEADGVVLKLNGLATQASLGTIGRDPRWAIAWKFAATEAVTVLEEIELTIGRSGAIIPKACLKPIELGGVMISRASLHNIGHVKALGLCEGDHVIVQRAGDVIPQVVQVLEELRLDTAKPWSPPQDCPSCGSKLTETSSSSMVFCSNLSCTTRHSRQVAHFARTLISGLGSATLTQLQEEGLVVDPADFYQLDAQALSNLKGFGKLSVKKFLKAIEESKQKDLWLFIAAVGIPRVGATTAKELAAYFGSLRSLLNATLLDLVDVPGIGEVTAACIFDWCQCEASIELINRLEEAGCPAKNIDDMSETHVKPESEVVTVSAPSPVMSPLLTSESVGEPAGVEESKEVIGKIPDGRAAVPNLDGKTVVITGDFGKMLREDMKILVKSYGGKVRTSVTSKTSFVLAGNRPGPLKISEAKLRGMDILDWESFQKLVGQTSDGSA